MKKIMMIIPSNNGTIARCSLNLYYALRETKDVKVKVVMVHKYDKGFEEFQQCDFFTKEKVSFVGSLLQGLGRNRWLRRIKKAFQPDLTISTLPGCSTLNVKAGGNDYKIGIFHAPNTQIKGYKLQYLISQYSYKHIYPKLDKLYCVNSGLYDFFTQHYPWIDKSKIDVVYNVHPVEKIRKVAVEELDNDTERDIFKYNKVILFCGRLEYEKVPHRLLRAFGKSNLSDSGYHLVFMGNERQILWLELAELAKELNIKEFVHYLGAKTNPYKYMVHSAVLASSSRSEGLPGVLIESLILGKPVVSTNSSRGVWEILSCDDKYDAQLIERFHTKDGIITPNTQDEQLNIEQLALALNEIVGEEYRHVEAKFIEKVKKEYIIDKYLNCIR